jgi:hypothetical protein
LQNDYHPKLFSLVQGLVLTALDKLNEKNIGLAILFTNFIFLTILLFSTYEIGKLKYNENIGLLAAILVSLCPIIFEASRLSMLDLPLTALVMLGLALLLKTEKLSSFFYSFCTGIVFGTAQLIKETAIIFILPAFIYYLFYSCRDRDRIKIRIANFGVIGLSYLIICAPIYFSPVNRHAFYTYWGVSFLTHHQSDFFYYLKNPEYFGILAVFLLLPLISYIIKIRDRDHFLITCFLAPLVLFSLSVNKSSRYLMPVLPLLLIILISEIWAADFKFKKFYIYVTVTAALIQFAILNFFPRLLPFDVRKIGLYTTYKDKNFYFFENLLVFFRNEIKANEGVRKIVFTFSSEIPSVLSYKFMIAGMPFVMYSPGQDGASQISGTPWNRYESSGFYNAKYDDRNISNADYIVDRVSDSDKEDISNSIREELDIASENKNSPLFKKTAILDAYGNKCIVIYKGIKN